MDAIYPRFARTDAVFYETPTRVDIPDDTRFALPDLDWSDWTRHDDGHWTGWHPAGAVLPEQGWKIHVSARPDVAPRILAAVARHCHAQRLVFKHLPHEAGLRATNAKDADRAGSGKFITVYPPDVERLRHTLDALDAAVGGLPGPYVLSDLRWREGPVSVRYGAFLHRSVAGADGYEVLALRHPDGHLVEDVRAPGFTPPAWVRLPDFLAEQRDALGGEEPPPGFPVIRRALHHSNAGGVYEGEDAATGVRVVVKEGRPHTGTTPDGRDAVARLLDEEATLRALTGLPVVGVHGAFTLHGHRFLLLERAEGDALQTAMGLRNPLIRADSTPADHAEYRQWALEATARVDEALSLVHAAGFTHGDVHPGNAVIGDDGHVTLLDFEMAAPVADDAPMIVGAPGFMPPDGRRGVAADRFGLGCIKLFVLYPLTPLLVLDPLKAGDLLRSAAATFALDDRWVASVHEDLALVRPAAADTAEGARIDAAVARWDVRDAAAVDALVADVSAELAASADHTREDRVWPGDPQQFSEDGVGIAHGVAGVVYAQTLAGREPDAQALDGIDATLHRPDDPRRPHRPGLWDGMAGVAWLYRRLGRHDQADALIDRLRRVDLAPLGSDLYGGLPGLGLLLLDECDDDPTLLVEALEIGEVLRARHDARPPLPADPQDRRAHTGSGGLLRGATGTALFALRLFERTGDADHLRLAVDALAYDLAHCVAAPDGSLQVNEGWRTMPYLAAGSAGIGVVLAQLAAHDAVPDELHAALDGLRTAALVDFTIEPGLFQGRAGLIVFLAALARCGLSTPASDAALAHHVAALRLHALRRPNGIAFPGQGLLRVSCDFATGAAGVLAALTTYAGILRDGPSSTGVRIPLLMPSAPVSPLRPVALRSMGRR